MSTQSMGSLPSGKFQSYPLTYQNGTPTHNLCPNIKGLLQMKMESLWARFTKAFVPVFQAQI